MRLEQLPQYLPHIPRENTRILLSLILAVVVVFSLLSIQDKPTKNTKFDHLTSQIVRDPTNSSLHQQLANLYLEGNNPDMAMQEILLALRYSSADSQELASQKDQIYALQQTPINIQDKISKLVQTVKAYPSYRDGYLMLGIYYWQVYRDEQAKAAIEAALKIDPNYQLAKTVKKIISARN
ncbi:hypothetical protein HY388_01380 [Candidatus Daviesbacteria bacterium]|nr:hypothetical protein [Candidatus Daviesbacteria bacterium]